MEAYFILKGTHDGPPNPPLVRLHELVWAFDPAAEMKIPMHVSRVCEDGSWYGYVAWEWGMA